MAFSIFDYYTNGKANPNCLVIFGLHLDSNFLMKVLIVCLGNICRSPLAEAILKSKAAAAGLAITVKSAGTNGIHTGEPPHNLSQKVARKNGLEICDQRSRMFIREDFEDFDIIYAMAEDVMDEIKYIARDKFDAKKAKYFLSVYGDEYNMNVPDPWYGDEDGYDDVYEIISKASDKIIESLKAVKEK